MYLDALTELVPWFFALDHTNYARWIPVHLRDMAELANKHPDVFTEFSNGHFTVQKTKRMFSAIPLDKAHEQNNAYVKGDGGAIDLTDNATALRRWMVAGPEVARVIVEFQDFNMHPRNQEETRHHEETPSVQNTFPEMCAHSWPSLKSWATLSRRTVRTCWCSTQRRSQILQS